MVNTDDIHTMKARLQDRQAEETWKKVQADYGRIAKENASLRPGDRPQSAVCQYKKWSESLPLSFHIKQQKRAKLVASLWFSWKYMSKIYGKIRENKGAYLAILVKKLCFIIFAVG